VAQELDSGEDMKISLAEGVYPLVSEAGVGVLEPVSR